MAGCFDSTTDFKLPDFIKQPSKSLSAASLKLLGKPYTPYTGQLTAGMTGTQRSAMDILKGIAPEAGTSLTTPRLIDEIPGGPGTTGGGVHDYMDPYLQEVLSPILRQINQGTNDNLNADDVRANFTGGYRDTGHQLERSEDKRLGLQAAGDATGKVYSDAFNTAQANRNLDINRIIQNRSDTAGIADELFGMGSKQQLTNQADLTAKYSEFLRKIGYDEEKVQKVANVIASLQSGTPVTQPSLAGTLLGGATSLAGAALGGGTGSFGGSLGNFLFG